MLLRVEGLPSTSAIIRVLFFFFPLWSRPPRPYVCAWLCLRSTFHIYAQCGWGQEEVTAGAHFNIRDPVLFRALSRLSHTLGQQQVSLSLAGLEPWWN